MAATPPGAFTTPPDDSDAEWIPAPVPGTVAAALAAAGRAQEPGDDSIDGQDWWFRASAEREDPGESLLRFGGIATVWEVFLAGEQVAAGESMFAPAEIELSGRPAGDLDLAVCCRALAPRLEQRRRPRARWRTRLAAGNLRFYRTTLHGRAPGFAPGPPVIGLWRPVTLERPRACQLGLRVRLEGVDGVVEVQVTRAAGLPPGIELELDGPSGTHRAGLSSSGWARLTVPAVERWWPHTHGEPALHRVRLLGDGEVLATRRVGFRGLEFAADLDASGLDIHVNGVPVFARGAVWTPVDPVGLAPTADELRRVLEQMAAAGMNMVRLPGTGVYETDAFHDLCDELGMLVWQDLMFANFDYPIADEAFLAEVRSEIGEALTAVAGRPSLAVVCGNSEVEQQVAMLGLDPELGRGELFGQIAPELLEQSGADAAYVPSAPCGGERPFQPSTGVANYFGVGGYRRPLTDARLAAVRFASECLAFANVGDGQMSPDTGVPRDVGSEWDFADVRDHYLAELYGVDPAALQADDPQRYLALSRAVSGDVMAQVMGEWRRAASPCKGALMLCLRDVVAGAGWGVIDSSGSPKQAYHHLRRALAPVAVWMTDEGLGGMAVHVANDGPEALEADLRLALYRDFGQLVDEMIVDVAVPAHGSWSADVESLIGGFRDVSWAYRFGPPAQDAVVATLLGGDELEPLSQAFRFPARVPSGAETAEDLGLSVRAEPDRPALVLGADRLVWGVRLGLDGWVAEDDGFNLEPGRARRVALQPDGAASSARSSQEHGLTALNLDGAVVVSP